MDSLERLAAGVRKFREEVFPERRTRYAVVAKRQKPETLLVTCADSRLDPELLTQSGPGDIFVERNPGNLIPVHSLERVGVAASIEYAVDVLGVTNIIICGHSDCGAVKSLLQPGLSRKHPAVGRWLEYGLPAVRRVAGDLGRSPSLEDLAALTEANVLLQMEHLRTHPCVARRLGNGNPLHLYGWVFDLGTGNVRAYDEASGRFTTWP
jgi:carbonic anhydrase